MSNEIELHVGLCNDYKLTTHKAGPDGEPLAGSAREVSGWSPNLITNTGLENFGVFGGDSTHWGRGCRVGSGNSTPVITDTNVQSIIASTVTRLAASVARNTSGPAPYVELTTKYRFNAGVAAGNVAEISLVGSTNDGAGAGGAMNAGTNVSTRALVVDTNGDPTVVVVLPDEILDVTVRQRLYIPPDVTGTITPTGGISPAIDYVIRPTEIDQNPGTNSNGWGVSYLGNVTGWNFNAGPTSGQGKWSLFVGAGSGIALDTQSPAGTEVSGSDNGATVTKLPYVPGSYSLSVKNSFPLGTANTGVNNPDGIGASTVSFDNCAFQIGFTPRILKSSDMLFDFTFKLSWGRYTP